MANTWTVLMRWLTTSSAVLTNLGEKMSDEEVDELLKAVDTSSGEINYTGMTAPIFPISLYKTSPADSNVADLVRTILAN